MQINRQVLYDRDLRHERFIEKEWIILNLCRLMGTARTLQDGKFTFKILETITKIFSDVSL